MEKDRVIPIFVSFLLAIVLLFLIFPKNITGDFFGIQQSFVLNLTEVSLNYTLNKFNDSSTTKEFDFPEGGGTQTYYLALPKNSIVTSFNVSLTGKLTSIYDRQVSTNELKGISIGNVTIGTENEISIGTKESGDGWVRILRGNNGTVIWNSTTFGNNQIYSTYIEELSSGYSGEEIAVGSEDDRVYILSSTGTRIWNYSTGNNVFTVVIADIDGDLTKEVVAGSDKVYVLNASGSLIWNTTLSGINQIAIGNMTTDPGEEIIVGCSAGKIYILNATGTIVHNLTIGVSSINTLYVTDITSDAGNEIVFGNGNSEIYIVNSAWSSNKIYTAGDSINSVKAGDITGDYPGKEIMAGCNDKKLYILNNTGSLVGDFLAQNYINSVDIGDLTSNQGVEVAAGGADGKIYIFNFDYFPTNLSIDVGADSTQEWNSSFVKLRTTEFAVSQSIVNGINSYLASCSANSNGVCQVPFRFLSDFKGRLNISSLIIAYSYNISGLISGGSQTIYAWSRTNNISSGELVGNETYNVSFLGKPSENITITYIVVDPSATKCEVGGILYTVTIQEGKKVCDGSSNPLILTGGDDVDFSFLLWDDSLDLASPINTANTTNYYSLYNGSPESYKYQMNLTLSAVGGTSTNFTNVTANWTINGSYVTGEEYLKVYWKGSWCEIVNQIDEVVTCNGDSSYNQTSCSGNSFFFCKGNSGGNVLIRWKQPYLYAGNSNNYLVGGSYNLESNLTNPDVSPNSSTWGSNFTFSVDITNDYDDSSNITLFVFKNQTSEWISTSTKTLSGNGTAEFNVTSDINWTGLSKYKFQYFDYNTTNPSQVFHNPRNTTEYSFTVLKHSIAVLYSGALGTIGNGSIVFRNESAALSVLLNDTDTGTYPNGVNCNLLVKNTSGSNYLLSGNTISSEGYCNFSFTPNQTFIPGATKWKVQVEDDIYEEANSTLLDVTIRGKLYPELLNQSGTYLYRATNSRLAVQIFDFYSQPVEDVSYNCSFSINGTNIGSNTTNSSGYCYIEYNPGCSDEALEVGTKNLSVNISRIGAEDYYNISDLLNPDSEQIVLSDSFIITLIQPTDSNYYKAQTINLQASVNDSCGGVSGVLVEWYLISKFRLNLTITDLSGEDRINYPVIFNGSYLSKLNFNLSNWKIAYTNVSNSGTAVPFKVYPWTTAGKDTLNNSQVYFTNLTELIFLVNLSAYQTKTYEVNMERETFATYGTIDPGILNAGFDSGNFSNWNIVYQGSSNYYNVVEDSGVYYANLSSRSVGVKGYVNLTQDIRKLTHEDSFTIRYKAWYSVGSSGGEFYVTLGGERYDLTIGTSGKPENWTTTNFTNSSISTSDLIVISVTALGSNVRANALIDYICFSDENCINFNSGSPLQINLTDKTLLGENTTTYKIKGTDSVSRRKLLTEVTKNYYAFGNDINYFNISGFAFVKNISLSSDFCVPDNITGNNSIYKCMNNANLTLICKISDNFTQYGIENYNVSFSNETATLGYNLTNSTGFAITDTRIWENITTYYFFCNITSQAEVFYNSTYPEGMVLRINVEQNKTTANLSIIPNYTLAENITVDNNSIETINFFLNNTGNSSMYNINVDTSNILGITLPPIYCSPIPIGGSCNKTINITLSAQATAQNHTVNFNVTWLNGDMSTGLTSNSTIINVLENKRIYFTQENLSILIPITVADNSTVLTLLNYGNVYLGNVTLSFTGGNSSIVNTLAYFNESSFSLGKLSNNTIRVTFSIPDNLSLIGVYRTNITATIQNCLGSLCSDKIELVINVTDFGWSVDKEKLNKTVGLKEEIKKLGEIRITNTEETDYDFNLSIVPNGTSYEYLTLSNYSLTVPALSTRTVTVYYDTVNTSIVVGEYNYILNITNLNPYAAPSYIEVPIYFTIINFTIDILTTNLPVQNISPQEWFMIGVNATEGSTAVSAGITWRASVGEVLSTVNSAIYSFVGGYWELNISAPELDNNPIENDLEITGNYTSKQVVLSDLEEGAIKYVDYTSPWFSKVSTSFINNNTYTSNYLQFRVNVTDNKNISSVWAKIVHNSSLWSQDLTPYNYQYISNDEGFDFRNYLFNFSKPSYLGDYDIIVYANDTDGNPTNSTKGWFDIYLPINASGNLTNQKGEQLAANFTFYRSGYALIELYKIHENSTQNQSQYLWNLHKRKYDVSVDLYGQNILLKGADFNISEAQKTNPFKFDYLANKSVSDITNIQLPETANRNSILLAIIAESEVNLSGVNFTIDYTEALKAGTFTENLLEIFVCDNWSYSNRICNDGEFSYLAGTGNLASSNPNVATNTFTFSSSHLSAYAIAESSYPNIWGSSPPIDPEDPGSLGGSSGGSTPSTDCGNGVCETGENSENCPQDCPGDFPLVVDTDLSYGLRVYNGDYQVHWVSLENLQSREIDVTFEITEGLQDILTLGSYSESVKSGELRKINAYLSIPRDLPIGTYEGSVILRAENKRKSLPIVIRVLDKSAPFYSIELEIATKTINPGDYLDFVIKLINLGEKKTLPINLTYLIKDQKTNKIIREVKSSTTLETTTIVREHLPMNLTEEGSYTLEVWADHGDKSIMDVATFELVKPLFESPFTVALLLLALLAVVAIGGTYVWKYYVSWRKEVESSKRYLYPLDYKKVPREGFKLGKFAGTDNYFYYDQKDLSTHLIVAGATGSGKSVSASVIAEEALDQKIPIVAFDPTAQWTGFVKACRDKNLLRRYSDFGMSELDSKSYPGLIYDIQNPNFKLNIKEFINPGEITVFCLNKLKPGEYDVAVENIINTIFGENFEESSELKLILVFDEVHRLLEKYGGKGGYVALEKAAREFRKWGIGIIMCSQVLADFKEAIAGNVLTEIQLNTKSIVDIEKVKTKYGEQYSERIARMGVGAGLFQYPKYNDGKPFFVEFRPTKHDPHKITDEELELYKKYTGRLKAVEEKIKKLKERKVYTEDYEIDLKLATNKLKTGNFRMAEIYIASLEKSIEGK